MAWSSRFRLPSQRASRKPKRRTSPTSRSAPPGSAFIFRSSTRTSTCPPCCEESLARSHGWHRNLARREVLRAVSPRQEPGAPTAGGVAGGEKRRPDGRRSGDGAKRHPGRIDASQIPGFRYRSTRATTDDHVLLLVS